MSLADLQTVADENAAGPQHVYGVFDPNRIPALNFQSFDVRDVRAAVSPDCSYRLIRDALSSATETIDLYIYNLSADHLLDLLSAARDRGIAVRIMYDVMDTRGDERNKIRNLDVEVREAPSSGRRQVFTVCHQKFAVIDRKSALLGSANWAASAIPKITVPGKFKKGNREWLVHIVDGPTAEWFGDLFQADWDIPALAGPQGLVELPPEVPPVGLLEAPAAAVKVPDEVFDIEKLSGDKTAKIRPITSPDNYFKVVTDLIKNAKTSIDLQQQYIKVGGPRTKNILQLLADRKSEVEIRILVSPAFKEGWEATVKSLKAAGLDDKLRAMNLESFTHLHNKGILVDSKFAVVTSTNWSENSITQAREAGVVIESEVIGGYYRRVADLDWNAALDPADVQHHLVSIADTVARLDEPTATIHPADLRLI